LIVAGWLFVALCVYLGLRHVSNGELRRRMQVGNDAALAEYKRKNGLKPRVIGLRDIVRPSEPKGTLMTDRRKYAVMREIEQEAIAYARGIIRTLTPFHPRKSQITPLETKLAVTAQEVAMKTHNVRKGVPLISEFEEAFRQIIIQHIHEEIGTRNEGI
jgi:hypothetical protein